MKWRQGQTPSVTLSQSVGLQIPDPSNVFHSTMQMFYITLNQCVSIKFKKKTRNYFPEWRLFHLVNCYRVYCRNTETRSSVNKIKKRNLKKKNWGAHQKSHCLHLVNVMYSPWISDRTCTTFFMLLQQIIQLFFSSHASCSITSPHLTSISLRSLFLLFIGVLSPW